MNGVNGYRLLRLYNSNVHTFELSKSKNKLVFTVGKPKVLETVSTLYKATPKAIAAVNCGFFNFDGSCENLFTWSKNQTTAVYTKDKQLLLLDAAKLTMDQIKKYTADAEIQPFGTGYTLVNNGKIDLQHLTSGDPYNINPRSMLGQLGDGSMILVVVQGRVGNNRGIKATEEAALMLSIGCKKALNLDGGGSSVMIVNGRVMNQPTDGRERKVGSALVACMI